VIQLLTLSRFITKREFRDVESARLKLQRNPILLSLERAGERKKEEKTFQQYNVMNYQNMI
jgi:hypothetical protein